MKGCDLRLSSDRKIKPQRRGATIAPHNGVPLVVNARRVDSDDKVIMHKEVVSKN